MEAKNNNPLDRVIIEDANENSDDNYEHMILKSAYYNIGMLFDKGKGIMNNE